MAENLAITFYGGAQQVTGACYLLEVNSLELVEGHTSIGSPSTDTRGNPPKSSQKILVDCGLVQGRRFCESDNLKPFPFDAASIDAVFITHAHTDHIGRVPKLVKAGFSGPIYSTLPTKELSALMLDDGLGLLQKDAESCGEEPPYGAEDVEKALTQWRGVKYHEPVTIGAVTLQFLLAGHILGSSMLDIKANGKRVVFSGDLGTNASLLMPPSDSLEGVDYLVTEATYGNSEHTKAEDSALTLERAIEDAAARRGTLMIPAFATERTQDILFTVNDMIVGKRIPDMPVFVDSPLAIKVTEIFEKYHDYFSDEVKALRAKHPHLFQFKGLKNTPTKEESMAINNVPPPKVIIAGSGMMTGGRILHHLIRYLPDPHSSLLIVGYQAAGSGGRRILDGASEVQIFNQTIPVRAKIIIAQGFSAHADKNRLFEFVEQLRYSLKHVFAVHAEPEAAGALVQAVRDRLGIPADAPKLGERFVLE